MTRQDHYECGKVYGILYHFEEAGQGLFEHSHQPDEDHNVICLAGGVLIWSGNDIMMLNAGAIYDLGPHSLVALTANTRILNLYKQGRPASVDELTEKDKHLVYDRKVEVPQHVMDVIQTWMAKCSLGHGHGRPEGEHLPENEKQGTIETTGLITVVQQL